MGVEPQTQGTTKKGESHFRNRILKMPPNNYIPEDLISLKEVNEIMLDAIIDIAYLFFFFDWWIKTLLKKFIKKKIQEGENNFLGTQGVYWESKRLPKLDTLFIVK